MGNSTHGSVRCWGCASNRTLYSSVNRDVTGVRRFKHSIEWVVVLKQGENTGVLGCEKSVGVGNGGNTEGIATWCGQDEQGNTL